MDEFSSLPGTVNTERFIKEVDSRSSMSALTDSWDFSVGVIDFSGMRKVVRIHGETARDQVLREAVSRLESVGCANVIGRVGQDKLALLIDHVGYEQASSWAASVRIVLLPLYTISGQAMEVERHFFRRSGPPVRGRNLLWQVERNVYVDRIRELQQRLDSVEPAFAGVVGVLGANEGLRGQVQHFRYLATRDPLTGLLNRRGVGERMVELSSQFSLAFIDIDDLRGLNALDRLYESGDLALRGVADYLRNAFGENDVARWGGDEFLVIAPEVSQPALSEALTGLLERCRRELIVSDRKITFSAGVAACNDGDWETAREQAQKELKTAKIVRASVVPPVD